MHRSASALRLVARLRPISAGVRALTSDPPRRPRGKILCGGEPMHRIALPLHDITSGMAVQEGGGYVSTASSSTHVQPHVTSRELRQAGRFTAARAVLDAARADRSSNPAVLVELLKVILKRSTVHARGGTGRREALHVMLRAVEDSPAPKTPAVCNTILSACAWEVTRIGENLAPARRQFLMATAREAWLGLLEASGQAEAWFRTRRLAAVWMYRVCGECRSLGDARAVKQTVGGFGFGRKGSFEDKDTMAAYLLCLGKCGRSAEADETYHSQDCAPFLGERGVLSALFQAHVASSKINKAEALIVQHGAQFLDVSTCHAFLYRCTVLGLREKALHFVERMRKSPNFPKPTEHTYNLLIKALCAFVGAERVGERVAVDRAKLVVTEMTEIDIAPSTVTYNALILQLADQCRLGEMMDLYGIMPEPDHLTFSSLMSGAAKARDLGLARRLRRELDANTSIFPNFSFCKGFLGLVAVTEGVETAFYEARVMSEQYGDALKMFGDVGGRGAVRMALIHACGLAGDLRSAFDVLSLDLHGLDEQVGPLAPLYIATELMCVCLACHSQGQALEVFHSMKRAGLTPNFEVYEKLISGLISVHGGGGLTDIPIGRAPANPVEEEDLPGDSSDVRSFDAGWSKPPHFFVSGDALDDDDEEEYDEIPGNEADTDDGSAAALTAAMTNSQQRAGPNAFDVALALLNEMHTVGAARSIRPACYVYNTMIAAAGRLRDLDLAYQIFLKMTRHNNPGVVYVVKRDSEEQGEAGWDADDGSSLARVRAMAGLDIFETGFKYPSAVNGTYNSLIEVTRVCSRSDLAFELFDVMDADRINEPSQATLALLADVSLEFVNDVSDDNLQRLLKRMDDITFVSPEVRSKRNGLRKVLLSRRWRNRGVQAPS